ncbi:MAG: hypothetical protein E6G63_11100 [Actinobacteria bacterium]|nr:MAG: hypothetical protein E6G63_11100 [Actinomycetota bacterium]
MKKGLVTLMAAVAVGTLGGAARPGGAAPPASAVARCDGGRPARSDVHGLAVGAGFAGADGGAIRQTTAAGTELIAPPDRGRGIVRHVASRADVASQPALSARGDLVWAERSGLRLVGASGRAPRPIAGPIPGGMTFSPLFASTTTIVVALAPPPTAKVPEDEYLSNLWRYDLRSSRWVQMTHFSGGVDRWTIVRTPFLAPDGSIQFVRMSGRASADRAPRYQLWRLRGNVALRLRTLPGEMFLAGFDGSARLWNIRAGATGAWLIRRERADGSLEDVGCGAVMVDPLDRTDPDKRSGGRTSAIGAASLPESPAGDSILVGDFSSVAAANSASTTIAAAFGSTPSIVDATTQPAVVRPGMWAVLIPIASGADAEAELARFRTAVPAFAGWSWIVSV